jgi:hypothetical protein
MYLVFYSTYQNFTLSTVTETKPTLVHVLLSRSLLESSVDSLLHTGTWYRLRDNRLTFPTGSDLITRHLYS